MKKLVVLCILVGFIVVMIFGSIYWKKQVALTIRESSSKEVPSPAKKSSEQETTAAKKQVLRPLPKHFPAAAADKLQTNHQLFLIVLGDRAADGWPVKLEEKLNGAYGEGVWTVTGQEWHGERMTEDLLHMRVSEIAELQPDMILLEIPSLSGHAETESRNLFTNVEGVLQKLQAQLPDCTVILQPPSPVYDAKLLEELTRLAEQNGYLYNDRWSAWSAASAEEILNYLKNEGAMTEEGKELRAQAVSRYFIEE